MTTDDSPRRCSECGSTTIRFDPPIAIEPKEACGEMKPGTYGQNPTGGIPVCMRPRSHEGMHGYLIECWETW